MDLTKHAMNLLGEADAAILDVFIHAHPHQLFHGRQIANLAVIPKTTAQRVLNKYQDMGLLKIVSTHGNMKLYTINKEHILYPVVRKLFSIEKDFLTSLTNAYKAVFPDDLTLATYGLNTPQPGLNGTGHNMLHVLAIVNDDTRVSFDQLEEVTKKLQTQVNTVINLRLLTVAELRKQKRGKNSFIAKVLADHTILTGDNINTRLGE